MKTSFHKYLKDLEKRKIISKKPHPLIPFLLAVALIILYLLMPASDMALEIAFKILIIFSIIFAIAHLIVAKILGKK